MKNINSQRRHLDWVAVTSFWQVCDNGVAIVTKPGKVQSYFLPEVLPDVVQGLVTSPARPLGPVCIQDLSETQGLRGYLGGRQLKPTLPVEHKCRHIKRKHLIERQLLHIQGLVSHHYLMQGVGRSEDLLTQQSVDPHLTPCQGTIRGPGQDLVQLEHGTQ